MPIIAKCPHCSKAYRVKDELAGQSVTCPNAECRQKFSIPKASAVGVVTAERARLKESADEIALKALADTEAETAAEAAKTVNMTCEVCEHKWDVPSEKQGKNVICPECRRMQRVPVIEKSTKNWREGDNLPSLVKRDPVPEDVASNKSTYVSGEAMRQARAIPEAEIEPRPRWHYAVALGTVGFVFFGLFLMFSQYRQETAVAMQGNFMDKALEVLKAEESDLPKQEQPLYRAAIHLAAGEYFAQKAIDRNDPTALHKARSHYQQVRTELAQAPRSTERSVLFAELAVRQVDLGGTEEEIRNDLRIRWEPESGTTTRPRINERNYDVLAELRQTMTAMRDDRKPVEGEIRFAVLRKLARELCKKGHPELIGKVAHFGFFEPEIPEARAQILAEIYRHGNKDHAYAGLDALRASSPQPLTGMVLARTSETPKSGWSMPSAPSSTGEVSDNVRFAYVSLYMLTGKADEAIELAKRPGRLEAKLKALSWAVEWSEDPSTALDAIGELMEKEKGKAGSYSNSMLVLLTRIAMLATQAGKPEVAATIESAISDEALKEWIRADILRHRSKRQTEVWGESEAPIPDNPKQAKLGHAWGRLHLARNNALHSSNPSNSDFESWGKTTYEPFGWAGLALGLQERERR